MVARRRSQAGKMLTGCLVSVLILAVGIYVGVNAFEVYWRSYRLQDFVKEQAGYAPVMGDDVIRRRLVSYSDTLGIPLGARDWNIRRGGNPRQITISAQYQDSIVISILMVRRVFRVDFRPSARAAL